MDPELVLKFKGDLTDWTASVAKAKTDLSSLSVGMNGTLTAQNRLSKGTNDSTRANEQLIASMNSLGRKMKEVANQTATNTEALRVNSNALINNKNNNEQALGGIGNLAKGYLSLAAVMKGGQIFLDSTKEVQKFENQLKVASGTQEQYGKNTQFLEGLAARYNKNVLDLGANFAQLTIATRGTNLEGEKTERLFAAVTATSAALQMSVDDTNGTFRAFIQMVSKGNVQAEELRGQLGERLYGAFNLAAKSMGVTTSELNKMLERGEVLAGDLLPKLTVELENTFGADAQKNAQNLGSNIDYATGQATLFIAELGKSTGITDSLNDMAAGLGAILAKLRDLNKEGGIVNGFFDRMLTLPGRSLGGGAAKSNIFKTKEERAAEFSAILNGKSQPVKSFSGDTSSVSSDEYGSQYNIRDINPKAEAKLKKQNDATARKVQIESNKWLSEKLAEYKDEMTLALADSEASINAKFRKQNGVLGVVGVAKPKGISLNYDSNSDKFNKEFSNQTTGDGKTKSAFQNLGSKISGNNLLSKDQIDLANSIDSALRELEQNLINRYGSLAEATKAGMGKFVQATKEGGQSYKQAVENIRKQDAIQNLSQNINASIQQAAVDMTVSFGEMAGSALAGGEGFENAGKVFSLLLADTMSNIGKAMIAFAASVIAAQNTIENPYVALAAGIAAVAAGAYLKTKLNEGKEKGFYTGGIVRGRSGVDNIPINVSSGEMILTNTQQGRLFGMLDGAYSGHSMNANYGSANSGGGGFSGELSTTIKGTDLDVLLKYGQKKNAKFRG